MRIGLAQMDIIWENVQKNKEKAEKFFIKAAENQVELLIFPEMSLTGFSMNVEKTTKNWKDQVVFFQEMSEKYSMAAIFGYAKPIAEQELQIHTDWKKYHNVLLMVDHGKIQMEYIKMHPFTYGQEGEYFQGGERIVCTRWKDTVLGGFICYDLRFPEIFQISSKQSEIIVVIANWPQSRSDQWDALLKARAIENQCFVAGVNRVGEGDGMIYRGHSAIYSPLGERITHLCEEESLLIGDVSVEQARHFRQNFPVKKDRREELYQEEYFLCV